MRENSLTYFLFAIFYFFHFGLLGILLPHFPVYLKHLGLDPFQIGVELSLFAIVRIGFPVIWGRIADQKQNGSQIAFRNMFFSSLVLIVLVVAKSFWSIFFVLLISQIFSTAVLPLIETMCLRFCHLTGSTYGRIRVWGSFGFLSGVLGAGFVMKYFGDESLIYLIIISSLLSSLFLLPLSRSQVYEKARVNFQVKWPLLMTCLLIVSFLNQSSHGAYYGFFSLWVKEDLHFSEDWVGYLWTISIAVEVLIMTWWAPKLQFKNPLNVLLLSIFVSALRWFVLGSTESMLLIAGSQMLHALTYGTFHLAFLELIREKVPSQMQATGQSLYSSVTFGLGNAVGFIFQGYIGNHLSYREMFLISSAIAGLGFLLMLLIKLGFHRSFLGLESSS